MSYETRTVTDYSRKGKPIKLAQITLDKLEAGKIDFRGIADGALAEMEKRDVTAINAQVGSDMHLRYWLENGVLHCDGPLIELGGVWSELMKDKS